MARFDGITMTFVAPSGARYTRPLAEVWNVREECAVDRHYADWVARRDEHRSLGTAGPVPADRPEAWETLAVDSRTYRLARRGDVRGGAGCSYCAPHRGENGPKARSLRGRKPDAFRDRCMFGGLRPSMRGFA